jgi:SEC-C motif-containing protein
MKARVKSCPCHSGHRYADCCGPLHAGARPAGTPEALMRSRYAAFALGLGAYLVETLASDHPDRALPRDALVRSLSRAHDTQRFLGLEILSAEGNEVHFAARIFEKGVDCSFVERSTFVLESGAWRYARGEAVPRADAR